MSAHLPSDERTLFRLALAIVVAVTVVRIAVLVASPLQLYPDEAQYWWWSQSLDWGYFSKPPLIAWIIRATTLFGDREWAIRLASPILHAGTALLLFGIGRRVIDACTGFWSGFAYATLPGVSYSSALISTDVPLLFCWSLALYAFLTALEDRRWRWSILCGLAIGLGLLAKYAMIYFLLGAAVATVFVPGARNLMVSARGLAIPILGLAVLSPNLIWNAAHGFPTFSHVEANANWGHARYSVISAVEFVLGQFGVFGPIMMASFVVAIWRLQRRAERDDGRVVLAAFSLPILALVIIQSFISDANANWAAVAYVGAIPLAVSRFLQWLSGRALWISLGLAGAAMVALWGVALKPSLASAVGQSNAFKRMQGWRQLGAAVAMEAEDGRYDAVAAGNRSILAELLFYARPRSAPIRAWDRNAAPHDHFQMAIPLTPASHRVLVVIAPAEAPVVARTFDSFRLIRTVRIPIGGNSARVTQFYDAQGYKGPQHWP